MSHMARVVWTPRARIRLASHLRTIRENAGAAVAADWGNRLLHAPDALARHPKLGRMVPEVGREDIRELTVPPYRILYRLRESMCLILTVRHARQLLTPGNFGR